MARVSSAWSRVLWLSLASIRITTSTIALYTHLIPRWLAIGGYAVAIALLVGSYYLDWSLMVFPLWVLMVSLSILAEKQAESVSG